MSGRWVLLLTVAVAVTGCGARADAGKITATEVKPVSTEQVSSSLPPEMRNNPQMAAQIQQAAMAQQQAIQRQRQAQAGRTGNP